jgi:hypothetical protein
MDSGLSLREPRNDETNTVIPEAAARGCPESILTMAVMDSGPAPDGASRNDEKAGLLLAMTMPPSPPVAQRRRAGVGLHAGGKFAIELARQRKAIPEC